MIRATTPTHIFNLPFETDTIKELLITYSQRKMPVVQKLTDDCVFDGKTIAVTLTQRDTARFSDRKVVEIQLRVLTTSDTALAGNITEVDVGRILDDDILGKDPDKKPTDIIGNPDVVDTCCCTFDVDFGEIYIIENGGSGGFPEDYEGVYGEAGESFNFVPKVGEKQIIPTANKYAKKDITVEAIPYAEVDNVSDGRTVTIG